MSGASKFILLAVPYLPLAMASLIRYDTPLATIISTRMAKIQTRSCVCVDLSPTARRMNVISATPVTP